MSLAAAVSLEGLSPARLWPRLEPEVRLLAARSLYAHDGGEGLAKKEANAAIAHAMRFRDAAVRQLPVEKRALYLSKSVQPSENLASSLLLALHLEHRRDMLKSFLDTLEIPNKNGLIEEGHEPEPPGAERVAAAAGALFEEFPPAEVEVYLMTLLAMDAEMWTGIEGVLRERA